MNKTLFEQILEVVEKYNSYSSLKAVSTTVYVNKKDETEVITESDFISAFKAGKSIADYNEVVETVNPKEELKTLIFGEKPVTTLYDLQLFVKACEAATGKTINFLTPKADTKKSPEQKEMNKAKQRVYNVAGGAITSITLDDAIVEADKVYKKYNKVFSYKPKATKPAEEKQ